MTEYFTENTRPDNMVVWGKVELAPKEKLAVKKAKARLLAERRKMDGGMARGAAAMLMAAAGPVGLAAAAAISVLTNCSDNPVFPEDSGKKDAGDSGGTVWDMPDGGNSIKLAIEKAIEKKKDKCPNQRLLVVGEPSWPQNLFSYIPRSTLREAMDNSDIQRITRGHMKCDLIVMGNPTELFNGQPMHQIPTGAKFAFEEEVSWLGPADILYVDDNITPVYPVMLSQGNTVKHIVMTTNLSNNRRAPAMKIKSNASVEIENFQGNLENEKGASIDIYNSRISVKDMSKPEIVVKNETSLSGAKVRIENSRVENASFYDCDLEIKNCSWYSSFGSMQNKHLYNITIGKGTRYSLTNNLFEAYLWAQAGDHLLKVETGAVNLNSSKSPTHNAYFNRSWQCNFYTGILKGVPSINAEEEFVSFGDSFEPQYPTGCNGTNGPEKFSTYEDCYAQGNPKSSSCLSIKGPAVHISKANKIKL